MKVGLVFNPMSKKYDLFEDGKLVWSFHKQSKALEAINKIGEAWSRQNNNKIENMENVVEGRNVSDGILFSLGAIVAERGYEEVGTSDFFALVEENFGIQATDLDLERYLELE